MLHHHDPSADPLDAVAAAPAFHRVLLENEHVRVLETIIRPGEIVPLHTHRWPAVLCVLSSGDFVRRDAQGNITLDSRAHTHALKPGDAAWAQPLPPHTLENVGTTTFHVVSTELKRAL